MAENAAHDYGEFRDGPGDNLLGSIRAVARRLKSEEAEVARLEEALQKAKERMRHTAEHELPGLMETAGMAKFALEEGTEIVVHEVLRGSIPKSRADEAHAWLEEHNSGGLIKREVVIEFDRGEEGWAKKFLADLAKRKKPVRSQVKKNVHPQTLLAYLREKLGNGEPVPLDLFGVFRQRVAKVEMKEANKPVLKAERRGRR